MSRITWYHTGPSPDLLLHGFMGAASSWDRLAACAPQAPLAALTLPGHHPEAPVGDDFRATVGLVAETIRQHARPPVRAIGYSLGGRVTLGLAAWFPELLREAVVIGAHPGLRDPEARAARVAQDAARAAAIRADLEAFVEAWERLPLFATQAGVGADALAEQRALDEAFEKAEAEKLKAEREAKAMMLRAELPVQRKSTL